MIVMRDLRDDVSKLSPDYDMYVDILRCCTIPVPTGEVVGWSKIPDREDARRIEAMIHLRFGEYLELDNDGDIIIRRGVLRNFTSYLLLRPIERHNKQGGIIRLELYAQIHLQRLAALVNYVTSTEKTSTKEVQNA